MLHQRIWFMWNTRDCNCMPANNVCVIRIKYWNDLPLCYVSVLLRLVIGTKKTNTKLKLKRNKTKQNNPQTTINKLWCNFGPQINIYSQASCMCFDSYKIFVGHARENEWKRRMAWKSREKREGEWVSRRDHKYSVTFESTHIGLFKLLRWIQTKIAVSIQFSCRKFQL